MKKQQPQQVPDTGMQSIDITGYFMPAYVMSEPGIPDQPRFLSMAGCDDLFLPVFSTPEKLRAYLDDKDVPYDKIKKIDDHHEFLDSIPKQFEDGTRVRIAIDLRPHDDPVKRADGAVRYTEIFR